MMCRVSLYVSTVCNWRLTNSTVNYCYTGLGVIPEFAHTEPREFQSRRNSIFCTFLEFAYMVCRISHVPDWNSHSPRPPPPVRYSKSSWQYRPSLVCCFLLKKQCKARKWQDMQWGLHTNFRKAEKNQKPHSLRVLLQSPGLFRCWLQSIRF